MTDTTTQTPAAQAATTQTATTTDTAPAATATQNSDAPAPKSGSTEPSSSTSGSGQDAPLVKQILTDGADDNSDKKDGANPSDANTDDANKADQSSEGEKSPEDKAKEGEEKDSAPVEYKVVAPEGMELDTETTQKAFPILKKYGVTDEDAQELVNSVAGLVSKTSKQMADQHTAMVTGWYDKTVAEFGADGEAKFTERAAVAQTALNKFMTKEERSLITQYGLGNFPGVFRIAYAAGMAMREDGVSLPSGASGGKGEETLASIWYPDATK